MFHSNVYVGIDIGLKGAVVVLSNKGEVLKQLTTPVIGSVSRPKRHDRLAVKELCGELSAYAPVHVAIDQPQSRRIYCERCGMRQGFDLTSIRMQSYAEIWRTAFAGQCASLEEVHPNSWRVVLKNMVGVSTGAPKRRAWKAAAIKYAKALYPDLNLRPGRMRTDHDGIAEAALIAPYLRSRILCGGVYADVTGRQG